MQSIINLPSKKTRKKIILKLNMKYRILFCLLALLWSILPSSGNDSLSIHYLRETYWEDMISDPALPFKARIAVIDSLINRESSDPTNLLQKKAKILVSNLMYAKSLEVYETLWEHSDNMTDREKLEILKDWTVALGMAGRQSGAAQKAIDFIKMAKPDSLKILDVDAYVALAFSKIELGMLNNTQKELDTATTIIESYKDKSTDKDAKEMELTLLRAKVTLLTEKGNYPEALKAMQHAFDLADDEITKLNLMGYVADIYLNAEDYEAAERYYKKILSSDYSYHNRGVSVCNYMDLLLKQRRYNEALDVLASNLSHIPYNVKDITTSNIIANKAEALAGLGDYSEAYMLMKNSKELRDSLNREFLAGDQLAIYELELETQKKEQALKEASNLRRWLWIVIGGLGTICVICLVLIIKWRKEKRVNDSQSSKLAQVDMIHKQQLESKDDKINLQTRELTSHALQLAQINELTNEILSITESKDESASSRLKNIQVRIKQYEMQDNMWEMFKTYFEQTHQNFFKSLYRAHPDLSPNEVRMCAYIMLNLTTKEIANITNRSPRTVETVKYRLHKKLGLEEETTSAYLNRIADTI